MGEDATSSCPLFGDMGGATELERCLLGGSADVFTAVRGGILLGESGLRSLDALSGRGALELRGWAYKGGGGGFLDGTLRPSLLVSLAGTGGG